jgi:hypothetical protein
VRLCLSRLGAQDFWHGLLSMHLGCVHRYDVHGILLLGRRRILSLAELPQETRVRNGKMNRDHVTIDWQTDYAQKARGKFG